MADISSIKIPNGTTYTVKDSTARNHIGNKNNPHGVTASQTGALPLTGGTMSGNLEFQSTGTTGTSSKIVFSGSTDGAQIYYNVPSSDQGNLVFNMVDDANTNIEFANGGAVKSYISSVDGVYHGKATNAGYADSAGNASKVNNHTVNADVPSGAKFTDTTYSAITNTKIDSICV